MKRSLAVIGISALALMGCSSTNESGVGAVKTYPPETTTTEVAPAPESTTLEPVVPETTTEPVVPDTTTPEAPPAAKVRTPVPQQGLSSSAVEAAYFTLIDEKAATVSHERGKELASAACDRLDANEDASTIITSEANSVDEAFALGAGVAMYCPEHADDINSLGSN
jgi:hypothetical protein